MNEDKIELIDGQVIEVEFDEELVKEYQDNYIMEEEGIGSEMGKVYGEQTEFNTDSIEELLDMDDVEIDSFVEIVEEGE